MDFDDEALSFGDGQPLGDADPFAWESEGMIPRVGGLPIPSSLLKQWQPETSIPQKTR